MDTPNKKASYIGIVLKSAPKIVLPLKQLQEQSIDVELMQWLTDMCFIMASCGRKGQNYV